MSEKTPDTYEPREGELKEVDIDAEFDGIVEQLKSGESGEETVRPFGAAILEQSKTFFDSVDLPVNTRIPTGCVITTIQTYGRTKNDFKTDDLSKDR